MSAERPPFVDAHEVELPVPPEQAYDAARAELEELLSRWGSHPMTRLLGTQPRAGFAVTEADRPRLLSLSGSHRFSRYVLDVRVTPAPAGGAIVTAESYAEFPGQLGAGYRLLVIGSRGHVLAVRRVLAAIRRRATDPAR